MLRKFDLFTLSENKLIPVRKIECDSKLYISPFSDLLILDQLFNQFPYKLIRNLPEKYAPIEKLQSLPYIMSKIFPGKIR